MNKKSIRVSDAIPDMPASFDRAVERTLKEVCAEQKTVRSSEEQPNRSWTPAGASVRKRSGKGARIAAYSAVALLLVAVFAIGAVIVKNALSDQTKTPAQLAQEGEQRTASAEEITEYSFRVELMPSFTEDTEPDPANTEGTKKISDALQNALETTTEDSVDVCVWLRADGAEEAISEQFKAEYPDLYNAYMYMDWNGSPLVQEGIEKRRQIAAAYYTRTNRERLSALLTDGKILFLSAYSTMCIINVPTVMVEDLAQSEDVSCLDLFVNLTSTPSAEEAGTGLYAIRARVTELFVNAATIQWTTELRLKKNGEAENPFTALMRVSADVPRCKFYNADGLMTEDAGAKLIDLFSPGSATASEDESDWILSFPAVCALPQVYDQFPGAIPPTGEVTVEQTFFLSEGSVEGQTEPGLPVLIGRLYQSFTFDAEKLLNVQDPAHVAVPLSGDVILTVHTETGYHNERVSLDGVTLDAEIRYTKTGVFVIVSIKDGGSLSEAQRDGLLQSLNDAWNVNESAFCIDGNGDQRMTYHVSRAFWGTSKLARFETLVLPEEYASVGSLSFELHAVYVAGEENGAKGMDWHWDSKDGSLPELLIDSQYLASFTIPLDGGNATAAQTTPPPSSADVASDALCLFVSGDRTYKPYENRVWVNQDDGLCADDMSFVYKMDEIQDKIPTIRNPAELTITAGDGVHLEPQLSIYDAELNFVAHDVEISVRTLEPGTYYVSQRVSRRETDRTSGYECIVRLVIGDSDPTSEATPEPVGDDPGKVLWNDPTAFPGTFRFWDYDMENGFREAPTEGVLFVCDFDGDGKEEEIRYEYHGSVLTISVGKKSVELCYGAGLEQAILLDLDPASVRLNLLVVYNTGSEDYETAELHMENGRFVRGPVIFAYCTYDGETLLGSATQTDMLGTKWGERTYHGEDLTPDSEWYYCDVIPDDIPTARDRESLVEGGVLLHLVRDLPCTIDGADAVIPADTYIYMTRWHESGTHAEIRTEDGTLTALVTVQRADPDDPEQYGYLIDGEMQDTYFDNIFYAD